MCVCELFSWLAREEACSKKITAEQRLEPMKEEVMKTSMERLFLTEESARSKVLN